jgi:hypothetical protein
MEDGQTSLHVAQFDGTNWVVLGQDQVASGLFGRVRMDVLQDDLYVLNVKTSAIPALTVSHFDGANWAELPTAVRSGAPSSSTGDIAAHEDGAVVAYVSGGVMWVKKYFP